MSRLSWMLLATALGACGGNGHVEQRPFTARPSDNVVNCACNLSFQNEHCTGGNCYAHFDLQVCLPQTLPAAQAATTIPDGGLAGDDYARRIDAYCRSAVTNDVYHLIKVFNGGWCDYKKPFAPDGGVGTSVECFAQELIDGKQTATARDDGTCDQSCQPVVCEYKDNCGEGVQDSTGNINLDNCQCNQVRTYGCPGDGANELPTEVFCRPPRDAKLQ